MRAGLGTVGEDMSADLKLEMKNFGMNVSLRIIKLLRSLRKVMDQRSYPPQLHPIQPSSGMIAQGVLCSLFEVSIC